MHAAASIYLSIHLSQQDGGMRNLKMAPATRIKPNSLAAEMAKKTKEMILDLHVKRMILERQNNNGRLPEGKMEDILDSLKSQGLDSVKVCSV